MRKKFIYIGLILIVVAFVLLFAAASVLSSTAKSFLTEQNITVSSMSFDKVQLLMANQSMIVAMISTKPVNLYLFNSSGFAAWTTVLSSSNTPSGYLSALSLEGSGLLFGYSDARTATIPYESTLGNETPFYTNNAVTGLLSGTYYIVVDNTNGSSSYLESFNASLLYPSQTQPNEHSKEDLAAGGLVVLGISFFALLIAGIILIAYGIIKKPPEEAATPQQGSKVPLQPKEKGAMSDEQIDKLYKKLEKKSKKKTSDKNG